MENENKAPHKIVVQFNALRKELEDIRQELYDTNRQVKLKDALLLEYQQEIEHLQGGEQRQLAQLESKIVSLEDTIVAIRSNNGQTVSALESEIAKNEATIAKLLNEIDVLKKINESQDANSSFRAHEEIANLQAEHEELKHVFSSLSDEYETLVEQHQILESKFYTLAEENSQLNETLRVKRAELSENVELIEKLNDELACANLELGALKNKPLDTESKGNSLFAEVDDRRVHLQHTINSIKSDYARLKFEHCKRERLITELKKEKADLCEKWKNDVAEMEEDQHTLTANLNNTISLLQESLNKLKKELATKPSESDHQHLSAEFRFYVNQVESKQKEIRNLEQKLLDRSLNTSVLSMSLAEANAETRKWRLEALKLRQTISETKEIAPLSSNDFVGKDLRTQDVTVRKKVLRGSLVQNVEERKQCIVEDSSVDDQKSLEASSDVGNAEYVEVEKKEDKMKEIAPLSSNDLVGNGLRTQDVTLRKKVLRGSLVQNVEERKQCVVGDASVDDQKSLEASSDVGNAQYVEVEKKEDKENIDKDATKRGVTFCESTVEPSSRPARKRGTRVFVAKTCFSSNN